MGLLMSIDDEDARNMEKRMKVKLSNEEDLFEIVKLANSSESGRALVMKCNLYVWRIKAMFEANGKNSVIVCYRNTQFTFNLKEADREYEVGRIYVDPSTPHTCEYLLKPSEESLETVIQYFMELFSRDCFDSVIFKDPTRDIIEICSDFPLVFKVTRMSISKPIVTKEELDYVSNKFGIKEICFHTIPPQGLEDFALKCTWACIESTLMLTWVHLANSKSEYITCDDKNITVSEFKKFVINWKEGKVQNENLKAIVLRTFEGSEEDFNDIDTQKWDPKLRGQFYKLEMFHRAWDCTRSLDVIRNDGTVASIGFGRCYGGSTCCLFMVWRKRFHEIPDIYTY